MAISCGSSHCFFCNACQAFRHCQKWSRARLLTVFLISGRYDSSRPDVVSAYPSGRNYTNKMSIWAAAVKREHPNAQIALLAMTWRPDMDKRASAWNDQVFNVPPELLANISAATLHPYFGISWNPSPGPPPPPPPPGGCGTDGKGASGPWVSTEMGCSDACCCADRCAARSADCRAWQWMHSGMYKPADTAKFQSLIDCLVNCR